MKREKKYVGLLNASKVSCHLSSAIQLFYHAIDEQDLECFITISRLISQRKNSKLGNASLLPKNVDFIIHLGDLFNLISLKQIDNEHCNDNAENQCIDPSTFYRSIAPKLDSSIPGDAASSLRVLLQLLHQSINYFCDHSDCIVDNVEDQKALMGLSHSLKHSLDMKFWNGKATHQLVGSKTITNGGQKKRITRLKPVKERPLPCILTLPMKKYDTNDVIEAFNDSFTKPQIVKGLDWNHLHEHEYNEEVIILDDEEEVTLVNRKKQEMKHDKADLLTNLEMKLNMGTINNSEDLKEEGSREEFSSSSSSTSSSSDSSSTSSSSKTEEWKSEKKSWISSVPTCLVCHIKRFEYRGGKVQNIFNKMNIPMEIFFCNSKARPQCCCHNIEQCLRYSLTGAIVYTDESSSESAIGDIGHYLCYFKLNKKNVDCLDESGLQEEWIKIDDEKVIPLLVSGSTSSTTLSGDRPTKRITKDKLSSMFGGTRLKSGYWSAFILLYNAC